MPPSSARRVYYAILRGSPSSPSVGVYIRSISVSSPFAPPPPPPLIPRRGVARRSRALGSIRITRWARARLTLSLPLVLFLLDFRSSLFLPRVYLPLYLLSPLLSILLFILIFPTFFHAPRALSFFFFSSPARLFIFSPCPHGFISGARALTPE